MGKMNRQVVAGWIAVVILACTTFVSVHSEILQPAPSVRQSGKITASSQDTRRAPSEARKSHE